MEIIDISGYTEHDKVKIAERHLVQKQLEEHGLKGQQLEISENALRRIVREYTRESGVRSLERQIGTLCRKVARDIVAGDVESAQISAKNVEKYLGIPKYRFGMAEKEDAIGVATGLAWTQVGGDVLSVEATVLKGKGQLTLTGKLGDVMKESAQASFSYVRSKVKELGIPEDFHEKNDIHIHVPEGAIPKDGPSAGITMATALASTLSGKPIRRDVAMTGEITLRGRVLPVGGIKEKMLAAHRAGIKKVLLPKDNKRQLEEVPSSIRRKMDFVLVEHMDEVLRGALVNGKD